MSATASLNNNSTSTPGLRPIIVTGPTGVGKSALSVELAERLGGEIIGADAFQIYTGLPILTAQPDPELSARIPHHLIGVLGLDEICHAARYVGMARTCIAQVQSRGKVPLLVGGTGMYLKALTHGLAELPPVDPERRAHITAMAPAEALARLREADPDAPEQIDCQNPVRVRRALEIVLSTGTPLAASRSHWKSSSDEFGGILLVRDRLDLRKRIEASVDAMFDRGVIEEVRSAGDVGPGASRAIGFREIQDMLAGRMSLHDCRKSLVTATQRYAKRQLTWCRHQFEFPPISLTNPGIDLVGNLLRTLESAGGICAQAGSFV